MLIYLASPYSASGPAAEDLQDLRWRAVCKFAAHAAVMGHSVQSPIAHWHPIAVAHQLPTHADFWKFTNAQLLRHCSELWVLTLDGWDSSVGVKWEMELATSLYIPIRYVKPGALLDPRMQP